MSGLDGLLAKHDGLLRLHEGVLHCAVATGDRGGSLDFDRISAATEVLDAIADGQTSPSIGSVLLYGEGKSFCTGGDVKSFAGAENRGAFVGEAARVFHDFILAVVRVPVPVVAAVHGWAAGAGMSIACACDVVVGGPATKFRPSYPSIGFSPDGGMSWTLPRTIGALKARDLVLTDGVLDGTEAERLGLLSRLVPDERVAQEAEGVAVDLATGPTGALGRIKRLLWDGQDRSLETHLHHEARAIAESADSADGREGVDAFTERRAPEFPV